MSTPIPARLSDTYVTFLVNRTILGGRYSRLEWDEEDNITLNLITGTNDDGTYRETLVFAAHVKDLAKVQMSSHFMTLIPKQGKKVIVMLKGSISKKAFEIRSASARQQFVEDYPATSTAEWKKALMAQKIPVQCRRTSTYLLNHTGHGLPTALAVITLVAAGHKILKKK